MAGVPRSQRLLFAHTTAAGWINPWVCPDAHITLVKDIVLFNNNAAASTIDIIAQIANSLGTISLIKATLQTGEIVQWTGWLVLNPGDLIGGNVSVSETGIWISGAVLAGPPLFAPAVTFLPRSEPYG